MCYTDIMADVHEFIKQRKYLVWSTQHYDDLSEEAIVEAVLNYGNWNDVQEMIGILGIEKVATIFRTFAFQERTNYRDDIRYYFDLYFKKYASGNLYT